MSRAIVFTRTKHGADRVVRQLHSFGIRSEAIHGNKSQNARQRALENFRTSKTPVLVATDIASRGIDIDDVSHVVNYDISHEPETYVHRIGRTARAGASGAAVSFCDRDELPNLKGIERLIRRSIPVKTDHPVYAAGRPAADHGPRRGSDPATHAPPARRPAQQPATNHRPHPHPTTQRSSHPSPSHSHHAPAHSSAAHHSASRPATAHRTAAQVSAGHKHADARAAENPSSQHKVVARRAAGQRSTPHRRRGHSSKERGPT
jgi:ATP-dependent RNA helicase RhlE